MKYAYIPAFAPLAAALLWTSTAIAQQPGGEMPPPAVTVVTVHAQDVTLTATLPGRALASAEAELRPQVNGIIIERLFDEGSVVAKGDPLYRIDSRSYEAAIAQAEASLAQATAQAAAAGREAERVEALRDRRVASEQTQDAAIATRDAANAAVKAAEAQVAAAQIDLDRTTISAPLDGVIGLAQTSEGALVTASQAAPLAIIRSIDPIRVDVTQSAAEIIRWQRQGAQAALPEGVDRTVSLHLADSTTYEHTGSITAAEPHVDETTGVVTLRMEFPNPDNLLLPGMYVLAEIPTAELKGVILAPQEGVTRDRRGRPIAYVVNAENVVEERQLEIVQDRGNQWVIREGLSDGERLVVEGFQRIGAGMTVAPEDAEAKAAAAEAAAGEAAPADGAPAEGAPAEAAPTETAPTETAPTETEPAATEPAETTSQETAPDAAPEGTAPEQTEAEAPTDASDSNSGN